jgi:hypothetical protein
VGETLLSAAGIDVAHLPLYTFATRRGRTERSKAHPESLSDIYKLKIKPKEILDLVKEMTLLHNGGEQPDWFTAVAILSRRHDKETYKVFCIIERMRCLADISKDERMRGWSMEAVERTAFSQTKRCLRLLHCVP